MPARFLPFILGFVCATPLPARQWLLKGVEQPVEAELVAANNGFVVLLGENGKSFELPLKNFTPANQAYIELAAGRTEPVEFSSSGKPLARRTDYQIREADTIPDTLLEIGDASEIHLKGIEDPLRGSSVHFTSADGWLFFEGLAPSKVIDHFLDRMLVRGARADLQSDIRVEQYASGSVVIPHGPDFPALSLFPAHRASGRPKIYSAYEPYGADRILAADSFILMRGYMATLAQNEDGTGFSRTYVAQDHDLIVDRLPDELAEKLGFIRIFPWNWCSKKGIAGAIHEKLRCGWFYDWNIGARSSPDLEYVAIRQNRHWPGMDQDWRQKGINHVLGFNEPDKSDQAKMSVDEAIDAWPILLKTGLRIGSPAVSDGGLEWLYDFISKAEKSSLRVDFVAVHYYRAVADPGDGRAAAEQLKVFVDDIHRRTGRPIWITEWNNGANWTSAPDPDEQQQRRAIEAMTEMLDEHPFVERYALYNWVEDGRRLVREDGALTPAGEVYRDRNSPVFFTQPSY